MRDGVGRKTGWQAVAVCAALLAGSGWGYRLLAETYARASTSVPLPTGTLAAIPLAIGEWSGQDQPLNAEIVRATDTDDLINRAYQRKGGRDSVSLFVAYGVKLRDLTPHRPEVCYPSSGWTLERTSDVTLPTGDSPPVACRVLDFVRSGLGAERVTVLNYYLVDGEYCADVRLLRSKLWRTAGGRHYAAQVQVACGSEPHPQQAGELVRAFGAESGPLIRNLLVSAVQAAETADKTESY